LLLRFEGNGEGRLESAEEVRVREITGLNRGIAVDASVVSAK